MSTLALSDSPSIPRHLLTGLAGSAVFGAAAGLGHGLVPALHGAWMAPVVFVGGAALATPPLYLAGVFAEARISAEEVVARVTEALGNAGIVLMGLAAPVAFFSATLRAEGGLTRLACLVALVGAVCVRTVARKALPDTPRASLAASAWTVFALCLGARLLHELSQAPVFHR